jgi:hypothetical protein
MRRSPVLLALPLLLATAACGGPEPYEREGTWQATGTNDANLRAMVADPAHLTRGARPLAASRGERAAIAGDLVGRAAAPQAQPGGAAAGPGGEGAAPAPQGGLPPLPPSYGGSSGRR